MRINSIVVELQRLMGDRFFSYKPQQPDEFIFEYGNIACNVTILDDGGYIVDDTRYYTPVATANRIYDELICTGKKFDQEKLRWDLVPRGTLAKVVSVLTFGAAKYDENNWQKVDNNRNRYYAAMMRHIEAWWAGERDDTETNIHHLAHAICCAMFLIWGDDNNGAI